MARPCPRRRLRLIAALAVVVLLYAAQHFCGQHGWPQAIGGIVGRVTNAGQGLLRLGWAGFLVVQVIIAISGFLPASLVGVSAGAAYGLTLGFATAALSTLTGAVVAFLLSRSLLRPFIERKLRGLPHLASLDGEIRNQGWRLVCLLRLSPVMPFAATSYALGLSSIAFGEYLLGSLASLPSLLGYVAAGMLVRTGMSTWHDGQNLIRLASLGIGVLSMIILAAQAARMLRRVVPAPQAMVGSPTGSETPSPPGVCMRALQHLRHRCVAPWTRHRVRPPDATAQSGTT
jgi:uncharacterized membrane protein YdjX (TVP38/TMEM64 family)